MEFHLSRPQWIDVSGYSDDERRVAATIAQLRAADEAVVGPAPVGGDGEFAHPDDWGVGGVVAPVPAW